MSSTPKQPQARKSGSERRFESGRSRNGRAHHRRPNPTLTRWMRFRANLIYLRRPFLHFLPSLGVLIIVLFSGSVCFHFLSSPSKTYLESLYLTYCLVFSEHIEPFPTHWILQTYYFLIPPVGLAVVLDGILLFSYRVLRRNENDWVRAMAKTLSNHVILCGLGKVGLRILQQLIELGEKVAVLEKDDSCPNLAFARKNNIPVLIGNGREEGIFDELNIEQSKAIILATDDDLANLEMALDARKAKPEIRVSLRMFDQELADKIRDSFDIQMAFSTSELAAPLFATSASDRTIINSFYINDDLVVVAKIEISPGSELVGKRIRDIGSQHQVFFLTHKRGEEKQFYPNGAVEFQVGDRLIVQTEPQTLKLIHRWNRDQE